MARKPTPGDGRADNAGLALAAFTMAAATMFTLKRKGVLTGTEVSDNIDLVKFELERSGLPKQGKEEAHSLVEDMIRLLNDPPAS